jgi:hypothetical protein
MYSKCLGVENMANRSLKKSVGLRLTEDALRLLRAMATKTGLSQAGVIELAIREKAARDGVKQEAA